jgi:DNA repair exonuclease SbcCD nuclease subunit
MKFIHSADWQLGARFAQFGAKSEALRQARLATLKAGLKAALERGVDAFLIAGDLFEDNQIDDSVIRAALDLFREFSGVPIFILPGNHDPHTGPDSIWSRRLFAELPKHITIFREPRVVEHAGGFLIASPLQQKVSTIDPSLKVAELAKTVPENAIKIGITHGALAIPGKHQPHDFPVALDAATRAGVDYLAVGHWHNWQVYDHGRLVMPGTPEPDSFEQSECGCVAVVRIEGHTVPPTIEKLPVATLLWQCFEFDLFNAEGSKARLKQHLLEGAARASKVILRVTLKGTASPGVLLEVRNWLQETLAPIPICQQVDQSSVAFSAAELNELRHDHPLLGQVLADLSQTQHVLTGLGVSPDENGLGTIPFTDTQGLLAHARIDPNMLRSVHFDLARQLLFEKLREMGV